MDYFTSNTLYSNNEESKKTVPVDYSRTKKPSYYVGNVYGYEARAIIEDFDLSYNVGTATTYLLRCGKKTEEGLSDGQKHIEDVQKAINHLEFEIIKLKNKYDKI